MVKINLVFENAFLKVEKIFKGIIVQNISIKEPATTYFTWVTLKIFRVWTGQVCLDLDKETTSEYFLHDFLLYFISLQLLNSADYERYWYLIKQLILGKVSYRTLQNRYVMIKYDIRQQGIFLISCADMSSTTAESDQASVHTIQKQTIS